MLNSNYEAASSHNTMAQHRAARTKKIKGWLTLIRAPACRACSCRLPASTGRRAAKNKPGVNHKYPGRSQDLQCRQTDTLGEAGHNVLPTGLQCTIASPLTYTGPASCQRINKTLTFSLNHRAFCKLVNASNRTAPLVGSCVPTRSRIRYCDAISLDPRRDRRRFHMPPLDAASKPRFIQPQGDGQDSTKDIRLPPGRPEQETC